MSILEEAKNKFQDIIAESDLEMEEIRINAAGLSPEEAIGEPDRQDYPLLTGKEVMIEARFQGARGQAFTDHPGEYSGTLREVLELPLNDNYHRALLTAAINAVLNKLKIVDKTIHCRDDEMEECVRDIVGWVRNYYPTAKRIGIIGFQPALLEAAVKSFGEDQVFLTDLNPERIGSLEYGVKILDGSKDTEELIHNSDFILATGSTVVNGTAENLVNQFHRHNKPFAFYGNTISGPAYLLDLPRLCFYGCS